MRIQHYSFGSITIDDRTYTSDVIIYPDRVDSPWWRREGHFLQMVDLKDVVKTVPEVVVIGTGHSGVMRVSDEVVRELKSKGIESRIARTTDAVNLFNEISRSKKTVACLHLTC
jgi:hypothetical protein